MLLMLMLLMVMVVVVVMLQDCHHTVLQYEFSSSTGLSLSTVFAVMEDACRDFNVIDDYSLSQNTLDNVLP